MNMLDFHQELQARQPELRSYLQKVAETFELDFKAQDYRYIPISPQEKVMLDFLGGCPGLPHSNWGDDEEVRRQKLPDFITSQEFMDYSAQLSSAGSVLGKEVLKNLKSASELHTLPDWSRNLLKRLEKHPALCQDFGVYICLKEPSKTLLQRMSKLLIHEWAHLLFFSNGIQFQQTATAHPEAWLFDEGLASWIEYAYLSGQWDAQTKLQEAFEIVSQRNKPRSVTGYFEKGLWFNAHFRPIPISDWPQELRDLPTKLPAA